MSCTFPPSQPDWSNLSIIHRNTLPPRSHFYIHVSESSALTFDSSQSANAIKLSGTEWRFHHARSPYTAPLGFEKEGFDSSEWQKINVPSMWQLEGYGNPVYTNFNYPFPVDPPNVPYDENQTGSYIHEFRVAKEFLGQQMRLRFEGVDSAFHVWINGTEVGYSQGSRNPSEFDVTSLITVGQNRLAVRVYQYCDGSYIEDQDQWRLSGIFRHVYLLSFPEFRIDDFHIYTTLDEEYRDADLQVKIQVHGDGEILMKLLDSSGTAIAGVAEAVTAGETSFAVPVINPEKWTAETPNLYTVVLSFGSYFIAQKIGFRKIEIKDGLYMINGQRVLFRGTNRHEHHPRFGRAVPYEWLKQDLLLMKKHNINAVRTSHQPSHPDLYDLADELGLYIMDEADLECHGFVSSEENLQTVDYMNLPFDERLRLSLHIGRHTSDNPAWEAAYVDRAHQLVHRDKNHACVVMWSLGNESFYGRNHRAMYDAIKALDETRPVHYEGDFAAQSADLYSRMYMPVKDCIEFVKGIHENEPGSQDISKPLVLCEFAHAMGNGPGNIKEYVDAFYDYPRFQGGWIWEWANHGLIKKNEEGEEFFAYGGDFGDIPNDGNFVMDGVCFSDHTPNPGLIEYKKAIEPVQVFGDGGDIEIVNRYDFVTLDHLVCHCTLIADGVNQFLGGIIIPEGLQPGHRVKLPKLEYGLSEIDGEAFLDLDFSLKGATEWAEQGHVVATGQVQIQYAKKESDSPLMASNMPLVSQNSDELVVTTTRSRWTFTLSSGRLTSWLKLSANVQTELLSPSGVQLTFDRAQTDNDCPQDGKDWTDKRVHLSCSHVREVSWSSSNGATTVVVTSRIAPPVLAWSIDTVTTYTMHDDGSLHITVEGKPKGEHPPTLPRIGLEIIMPAGFEDVTWFGRGPGESYIDKKMGQRIGNWENTVDSLWTAYEMPQESSNRTDVRWVTISSKVEQTVFSKLKTSLSGAPPSNEPDERSLTAQYPADAPGNFMTSHYHTADIEASKHPFELRKKKVNETIVRLDWAHHGLGTGSCGQKTLDQYALQCKDFAFQITLT